MPQTQPANKNIIPGSLLPIRTITDLTGINPVTLRASLGESFGTGLRQVSTLLRTEQQR
jgi:hypothetical protein